MAFMYLCECFFRCQPSVNARRLENNIVESIWFLEVYYVHILREIMDICRVCLARKPDKDINELNTHKGDDCQTYADILLFCLDIQVIPTNIF